MGNKAYLMHTDVSGCSVVGFPTVVVVFLTASGISCNSLLNFTTNIQTGYFLGVKESEKANSWNLI